jgi:hypothetical protein
MDEVAGLGLYCEFYNNSCAPCVPIFIVPQSNIEIFRRSVALQANKKGGKMPPSGLNVGGCQRAGQARAVS